MFHTNKEAETDPTLIESNGYDVPHESDAGPLFIDNPETTASIFTTTTTTETPLEGSGEESECRGDDAVRCDDGSKVICSVQKCDGNIDCDDGGDERNCQSTYPAGIKNFEKILMLCGVGTYNLNIHSSLI